MRRNLVEWQWLFFVWTVELEGSRTLEPVHYTTLTSVPHHTIFSLSALYFWTYSDIVRSFLANRLSPPPLCVTCSWAESAGWPRSWMPGYRQVPGPSRGPQWAAGICTWQRKLTKGIVLNIPSLLISYTHRLCFVCSRFHFHSHLYIFVFYIGHTDSCHLKFNTPQSTSCLIQKGIKK